MQAIEIGRKYDLTIGDLLVVVAAIGGLHYAFSLLINYNEFWSIAGLTRSADVGVTAAFGVLVYTFYRMLRSRPR
jgi:hypothetical protein